MINEIFLGGVSSKNIKGLIIQTLPPISKPKMRTKIEEINGKDGDNVTYLGFSAYDKSFSIGLSSEYNIDEIIDFFNTEGTVTFSNEPDKYYNYTIFEGIDFERLIRFKTATVTMHVQPFKYSLFEEPIEFITSFLNIQGYLNSFNGVTVDALDDKISVSGEGTEETEFYIQVDQINLEPGDYILSAYASGTNADSTKIRLIGNTPSEEDSFGGTDVTLQDNESKFISATLNETGTYNYIYLKVGPNVALNFDIYVSLRKDGQNYSVINKGNIYSEPTLTIFGAGTINLYINEIQTFVISLGDEEYIVIDSSEMEAYKENILKNRLVMGDYENFQLNEGINTISFTGGVTKFLLESYSRWL